MAMKEKKMSDMDRLARDIAFEIVLGGDRFDPSDVKEMVGTVSRAERNVFQDRIRYHAVDFAPEEYRTAEFLDRNIEVWTGGLKIHDGVELRQDFDEMLHRNERGAWFRFSDGSFLRCEKAVSDAMWNSRERFGMDPDPVSPYKVALYKSDALINKYGHQVKRDMYYHAVDLDSYGMTSEGSILTVMRQEDIVSDDPKHKIFVVVEKTPEKTSAALLSQYPDEELERLIGILDTESSVRQSLSLMKEGEPMSEGAVVALPEKTIVTAPEQSPYGSDFVVTSVFVKSEGFTMVSGHYVGMRGGPERNFLLRDFSDKGVATIKNATDVAMKNTLAKLAALETGRKNVKVAGKKLEGPSL